jgi:hypothetical protein
MEERVVKKLMTSVKCTSCGQNYHSADVEITGHHFDLYFLQVCCSSCHSRFMLTVVVTVGKNPEIITDLNPSELADSRHSDIPTANDVLDMHAYLRQFNGDFNGLFGFKKV